MISFLQSIKASAKKKDEYKNLSKQIHALIGIKPKNIEPFITAFTFVRKNRIENFEKLEFLGDSVLNLVIAECLYKKYPMADEGFLTKMRSKIVSRNNLNEVGKKMGLDMILAILNPQNHNQPKLGDILEAMIGAIYIDTSYSTASKVISERIIRQYIDIELLEHKETDSKSKLIELAQKTGALIEFELLEEKITKNANIFKIAVKINGEIKGVGIEKNKKNAEQSACANALESM